ncbi:hypothetical protein KKG24_04345 [Patescibacteria group bacterium]|nr:hypothetical protein [Patescibacteria group bacterium]
MAEVDTKKAWTFFKKNVVERGQKFAARTTIGTETEAGKVKLVIGYKKKAEVADSEYDSLKAAKRLAKIERIKAKMAKLQKKLGQ